MWDHTVLSSDHAGHEVPLLGMIWHTGTDFLKINVEDGIAPANQCITKRTMLSNVQKIFDPIGFTLPATLLPKLWLQHTWKEKISWDEELSGDVRSKFKHWLEKVGSLRRMEIPRWFGLDNGQGIRLSLHTFCDASKTAYAAVVFLRLERADGVMVSLVQGKSRVAPMKELTVPRLELLAAVIGVRLCSTVVEALRPAIDTSRLEKFFWSDSTTVLTWIKKEEPWSVFVFNRVKARLIKA